MSNVKLSRNHYWYGFRAPEKFFQKFLSWHQRKSGFWAKINYSGHNFSKSRLNQIPFRSLFCYRRKNSAQNSITKQLLITPFLAKIFTCHDLGAICKLSRIQFLIFISSVWEKSIQAGGGISRGLIKHLTPRKLSIHPPNQLAKIYNY